MGLLRFAPNILLITRAGRSGPAGPVLAGPLFHSSQKNILVGFDQCFTAWERESSKYGDNVATLYSVLATTDCQSVVSSTGLESCTAVRV